MILYLAFYLLILPIQGNFKKEIKVHRDQYKKDFLKDERSPLDEDDLKYLDFYSPKKKYKFDCIFKEAINPVPFNIPTYSGIQKPFILYGYAYFDIHNNTYQIALYKSLVQNNIPMYRDYLFVPFKDHTNGVSTYGGGRYINLKTTDIVDGRVIIDFNKCYNPWCAFSEGFNCPIPPLINHLDLKIKAGEKNYKGSVKEVKSEK